MQARRESAAFATRRKGGYPLRIGRKKGNLTKHSPQGPPPILRTPLVGPVALKGTQQENTTALFLVDVGRGALF